MAASKIKKKKSLKRIFKRNSSDIDDEALDASLMKYDRQKSSKNIQFDNSQTEMLEKIYDYHNIDIKRLKNKFKNSHQFDAFMRKNETVIDNACTANTVILGTSGSGKTKIWWNFLNYFNKSYLARNSWAISPKDFYYIITEKIMNISVDILIEYNYYRKRIYGSDEKEDTEDPETDDAPLTCLSKNDLMELKEYKLELEDEDIQQGYDYVQDLISKLEKIRIAIYNNVEVEEKKKLDGIKPNWDKIQELRNIEKKIKEFTPSIAPMINKLWKSKQLRNMYLYQYGLNNARNLFYFIDNINKFVLPNENNKWEWQWSFDEILRCQIRTTGVIEQTSNLSYDVDDENNDSIQLKNFCLKLRIWDVGGAHNERKKWRHILNMHPNTAQIDCVLYVVNLMSYYKKSYESNDNDLVSSLELFSELLSVNNNNNNNNKVCVDNQVKKATQNIRLFYIIFTDIDGLQQMLNNNISFQTCFGDYKGDNSAADVQMFIQNKFESVFKKFNLIAHNTNDDDEKNIIDLKRMKSDPLPMKHNKMNDGMNKILKCRFVSVIDHFQMKSVMNEIVELSMLNKKRLDGVINSLLKN